MNRRWLPLLALLPLLLFLLGAGPNRSEQNLLRKSDKMTGYNKGLQSLLKKSDKMDLI